MSRTSYLFDTNAILEAVRTGSWNALTGGLRLETVAECEECRRGDRLSDGYVYVSEDDVARISAIRTVGPANVAALLLLDTSDALDAGERDLFAYALSRSPRDLWMICSPDQASVRFAVANQYEDRLMSLEDAIRKVGARPTHPLRSQFTSAWLAHARTMAILRMR